MRILVLALLLATSTARADDGVTFEASIGVSKLAAVGPVGGNLESTLGGPSLGFGGFLSRRFALGVRLSGATMIQHGAYYVGTLAPSGQLWLNERFWIGGGAGLGVIAGCSGGCDAFTSTGIDARLGYAFAPVGQTAANLSIELTGYVPKSKDSPAVVTVSALVGVQTF